MQRTFGHRNQLAQPTHGAIKREIQYRRISPADVQNGRERVRRAREGERSIIDNDIIVLVSRFASHTHYSVSTVTQWQSWNAFFDLSNLSCMHAIKRCFLAGGFIRFVKHDVR